VIGQVRPYRIRKGDTLIDLARYYDLGYNEIVDANPAIDPWVPPVGATSCSRRSGCCRAAATTGSS
jgi:L,D-transpeptidase ErfK/SrfK